MEEHFEFEKRDEKEEEEEEEEEENARRDRHDSTASPERQSTLNHQVHQPGETHSKCEPITTR